MRTPRQLADVGEQVIDGFRRGVPAAHETRAAGSDEVVEQPAAFAQAGLDAARQGTKTPFACTGKSAGSRCPAARPAGQPPRHRVGVRGVRNQAPSSRMPSQGAERKRIFDASCPACLQR
jgi:hypothetical protein